MTETHTRLIEEATDCIFLLRAIVNLQISSCPEGTTYSLLLACNKYLTQLVRTFHMLNLDSSPYWLPLVVSIPHPSLVNTTGINLPVPVKSMMNDTR